MNKNFNQLYRQLNLDQKRAVNATEGPVLCLAGPGTGKTQVLVLRIANILKRTQMNPYNILCLTFTDAGASEMRQRLIGIVGTEGYDATIATFHSFSRSIIAEFPDLFGYATKARKFSFSDLKPLDDLTRHKIIEKILLENDWRRLKPSKQNLHYLAKIIEAIKEIKRERLTPKNILKPDKKDRTLLAKIERTKELFDFFKLYQKELTKNGCFDFEDMINWVVDEMEQNRDFRLLMQERYQYILIDEYQDSNNAQIALIKNLTSFYGSRANVFAVGDPDQSIYRFQGASEYNVAWFKKHFPKAKIIALNTSYRARQNLLDAAEIAINNTGAKRLKSMSRGKGKLILFAYETREQESDCVAIAIKSLIKNGAPAKNIAILVRQNNQIGNYLDALSRHKIPFQTLKPGNIFENPTVIKMLAVYHFLAHPFSRINWGELAFYLRENIGLDQSGELLKLKAADFLKKTKKQGGVNRQARLMIEKLLAIAERLADAPPAKILQKVSDALNITQSALKKPDYLERLACLKTLFDLAKNSTQSSIDFIADLDAAMRLGLSRASTPILLGEENAVVVQTVHQAKGREYETVFLPEMQERLWLKNPSEHFAFSLLTKKADKSQKRQIALDETRRLFYVGLTRAKKNIFVSYAKNRDDEKNEPSRFFFEIATKGQNPNLSRRRRDKFGLKKIQQIRDKKSLAQKRIIETAKLVKNSYLKKNEKAFLADAVKNFALSPTSFNSYMKCPQDFLFKHILRVPQIKKPFLSFGTATHKAMEIFSKEFIKTNKMPDKKILLDSFAEAIAKEILDKKELEAFRRQGRAMLESYFEKTACKMEKPIWAEYDFGKRRVHLGGAWLAGKIDKIEWLDESQGLVRVVDYKTGRARSENEIRGLTKRADESYLNQLKFYWLLGGLDRRFGARWKIGEVALDFLDDGFRFPRRSFVFSDKEIDGLKNQIRVVHQHIQALKFPHIETPGKPCDWCGKIS